MKINLIKVPAEKDSIGYTLCINKLLEYCYFYSEGGCSQAERYPACSKEGIIWLLEVKDD